MAKNEMTISRNEPKDLTPKLPDTSPAFINLKEQKQKEYLMQRDTDRTPVKGIFKYYEVPGGILRFVYKKYPGDQVQNYEMTDGDIYTIPLGVAVHLNKNGWYAVHAHTIDINGLPVQTIGKKVKRFGFQSLEFMPDADENFGMGQILTVKQIQAQGM